LEYLSKYMISSVVCASGADDDDAGQGQGGLKRAKAPNKRE